METHKRILGILFIVSGSFQILLFLLLSAIAGMILPFVINEAEIQDQWIVMWLIPILRFVGVFIILMFSVPSIVGGIGILYHKKWALTLVMIMGCFKLFSVPIGTALGIYAIWVFAEDHRLSKLAA